MASRVLRTAAKLAIGILLLLCWVWAIGAAWHFTVTPPPMRWLLAATMAAVPIVQTTHTRRWRSIAMGMLACCLVMATLWQFQRPSNEGNWQDDLAITPRVEFETDSVMIDNYLTLDGRKSKTVALEQTRALWLGVEKFPDFEGGAHNFLTFELNDGTFLSVSVEARREVGEAFALRPALFRQFELIYLIGDEAKVFADRTNFEGKTFLYPLKSNAKQRGELLVDIFQRANKLSQEPEWYNIVNNNCTNNLAWHASRIAPTPISTYDPRIIFAGHVDDLMHELNLIDMDGESNEVARRCRVDERARGMKIDETFSRRLRSKR